jgi:hypothetical protein
MKYLYRGVHAKHPQIASARAGVVVPGDPNGTITAKQHNAGGFSELSPYTSWSERIEVARTHAFPDGEPRGVVLRVPDSSPGKDDAWDWESSPDTSGEYEVLLFGVRMGLEVIEE